MFDPVFARDFLANLGVQCTHGINGAEIQILAINEGAGNARGHGRRTSSIAIVHHPRFNPGVALPFAPLRNEIVFEQVTGADQRTGVAIGSQSHIYPEDLAVFR